MRQDASPLATPLGASVDRVETFADAAGQALYYVVYLQPAGFAIVPADDEAEPIVCFAAAGTYDPSPANPLGALVSGDVPARIKAVRGQAGAKPSVARRSSSQGRWRQLILLADNPVSMLGLVGVSDVRVAPFVLSRWDQRTENGQACYNYYTPPGAAGAASNYPSGCVATAMAQLMRYHQHPTSGIGVRQFTIRVGSSYQNLVPQQASTRGGDGFGGPYNWALMMLDPDYTITLAQRQAIGALLFDAGISCYGGTASESTYYTPGGTGAYLYYAAYSLVSTFGYSNAMYGQSDGAGESLPLKDLYRMVNPNVDAGLPVLIGIDGSAGGHAVIVDGYGYNADTNYHHLNMGWGGSQDAWYNLPNVDSTPYSFNVVQECVSNIYPTGSGEIISGRVTDPSGNPLGGLTVTAQRSGGGTYTTTTSSRGVYAFAKVPAASVYTISVSGGGYVFENQMAATGTSKDIESSSGNRWGVDFPRRQLYTAYMSSNPGWTLDTGWAWGTPGGGGSYNGDPSSGSSGSTVVGYNLSGNYANNIPSTRYAKLGPIDCHGCDRTKLRFRRWLGVDVYANDKANLQVSSDGANWTEIWNNADGQVFDYSWQEMEYDISAIADNQPTVYIRWGMGPTNNNGAYPGWNIDDVEVTGHAMPLQGDINSDGFVNVGDLQLLVATWGSGPGYAGPADLNGDGFVNVGDLQILVTQWGQS